MQTPTELPTQSMNGTAQRSDGMYAPAEASQPPTNGVVQNAETMQASTQIPSLPPNGITKSQVMAQTRVEHDPPLFAQSLISPQVSASLQELGYSIRPLRRSDYSTGYLDCLRVLTTVGEPSIADFDERFDFISSRNDTYYILVVCDTESRVVGTGCCFVERKFIHNMGLVGHVEDIAVAQNQQGKKLGLRIIQALDYVAENVGCYKCILDCSEANEGFYVKCGFKRAGLEMAHYYEVKH